MVALQAVAGGIMGLNSLAISSAASPRGSQDTGLQASVSSGSMAQPRYEALKEDYKRHEAFSFLHTVAVTRGETYTVPEIAIVGAHPSYCTGCPS
jgi:hypothetical protein